MNDNVHHLYFPGEHSKDAANSFGSAGSRAFMANSIRKSWREIALRCAGVYVTSSQVLHALHALDIRYTSDGRTLKRSNLIGKLLDSSYFSLPWENRSGRKAFFLPALEMSAEDRRDFWKWNQATREEIEMNAIGSLAGNHRNTEDLIEEGLRFFRAAAMAMLEDEERYGKESMDWMEGINAVTFAPGESSDGQED